MGISIRKTVLWTLAAGVIGAGIAYSFQEQPVPVDIARATIGPMEVTINADGETRIRNIFEVSAPVGGTILRSPVEVGDLVIAGETIVGVIEPNQPVFLDARSRIQAEAAVKEAEAALRLAELNIGAADSNYDYAHDRFDQAQQLSERGTLTQNALEEAPNPRSGPQRRDHRFVRACLAPKHAGSGKSNVNRAGIKWRQISGYLLYQNHGAG